MDAKKTLSELKKMKKLGTKIVCLTAYDAALAHWEDQAGVDVILVGDSLGMVVQGHETTLPVTLDDMVYHTQLVQRGNQNAWCVADIPFMADASPNLATEAATRLMKEAQANMVKLEGGRRVLETVSMLSAMGVPVCGHLGLLPQSVQKKGYQVVGKEAEAAEQLLSDARDLETAGAEMLVLECVPTALAEQVSKVLTIPVIGIGSGVETDGQVLVISDILGLTTGRLPKFAKNYLAEAASIQDAIERYCEDVRNQRFPDLAHQLA